MRPGSANKAPAHAESDNMVGCRLTVINAPKTLLQALQVQFSLAGRVQSGPETLNSGIAFVGRLSKPSLGVRDQFGGAHGDGIEYASGVVQLGAATGDWMQRSLSRGGIGDLFL